MFNFRLKNKFFSFNKKGTNYNLRNNFHYLYHRCFSSDLEEIKTKTRNINLVNADEILNFISDKDDIIDLIEKTHSLIEDHFPEADSYLKLHEDMGCCKPSYKLLTHIMNEDESTWEERYDKLISEFVDLKRNYPDYVNIYSIVIGLKP